MKSLLYKANEKQIVVRKLDLEELRKVSGGYDDVDGTFGTWGQDHGQRVD